MDIFILILALQVLLFQVLVKVECFELFRVLHFHVIIFERAFPNELRLLLIQVQVRYEGRVHTELIILFILVPSASPSIIVSASASRSFLILLNELCLILPELFLITFWLVKEVHLVRHHHHVLVQVEFVVHSGYLPILLILLLVLRELSHFA